jgi:YD repeat-containing protein
MPGNKTASLTYHDFGIVSDDLAPGKYRPSYVKTFTDSLGNTTHYDFDYDKSKEQFYAQVQYPSGRVKEMWFNKDGDRLRTMVNGAVIEDIVYSGRTQYYYDRNGNETVRYYDEKDNLIREIKPDETEIRKEYDFRLSKPTKVVDERGIETLYEYDDFGNLVRKTEAAGTADERITEYTHDGAGNVLTEKVLADANTAESLTSMTYDDSGNMTSIIYPAAPSCGPIPMMQPATC